MRRLTIIVAAADGARLYAALEAAMAVAALGHDARLFLQGEATALLRLPIGFAGDGARRDVGLPDLAQMIEEAAAMDVELIACQSGLALAGLTTDAMAPQARAGGLVGLFADIGPNDRLLVY